ncbi:MAG TPA: amidohydrolase family protein, partial [Gammaproteobacteria bacterium]|nr:amidohydrolase family protein [Gammaproteobacteria bacterium]
MIKEHKSGIIIIFLILGSLLISELAAKENSSLLIINAKVIDGTGSAARLESVRINDSRIQGLGQLRPLPGETILDATGLVLSPGFIDTHSHHDISIFQMPDALSAISQGITTIVVGLDGFSQVPLSGFFAKVKDNPLAVNIASYSGHNSLRNIVMGQDYQRFSTPKEIENMKNLLRLDMKAGALGLSTGLEYDPGIYSEETDEVVALLEVFPEDQGRYASHIRSEDVHLESALDEFIEISRKSKLPSQISHIKLARRDLWGQTSWMIDKLNAARQ